MVIKKQMVSHWLRVLLFFTGVFSAGAQSYLSSIEHDFSLGLEQEYDGLSYSDGVKRVQWESPYYESSFFWVYATETYDPFHTDLSLLGLAHTHFTEMDFSMNAFHSYYRDGEILEEAEMLEIAKRNTITATDINRELSEWDEGDYFFSEQAEIQVLEVTMEPEIITVGVLEPVPEPTTISLLALSSLCLLRRKR